MILGFPMPFYLTEHHGGLPLALKEDDLSPFEGFVWFKGMCVPIGFAVNNNNNDDNDDNRKDPDLVWIESVDGTVVLGLALEDPEDPEERLFPKPQYLLADGCFYPMAYRYHCAQYVSMYVSMYVYVPFWQRRRYSPRRIRSSPVRPRTSCSRRPTSHRPDQRGKDPRRRHHLGGCASLRSSGPPRRWVVHALHHAASLEPLGSATRARTPTRRETRIAGRNSDRARHGA